MYSEEQQQCEDKFKNSLRRFATGRFVVSLPFKSNIKLLGSSFAVAKRFLLLGRRLFKGDKIRQMYHDFIKEYFNLLTDGESYQDLISIRNQATEILSSAVFNLAKWFSNYPEFVRTFKSEKLLHDSRFTLEFAVVQQAYYQ